MQISITDDIIVSDLGFMRPVATPLGVTQLDWQQGPFAGGNMQNGNHDASMARKAATQIAEYLEGVRTNFSVPIDYTAISEPMRRWYEVLLSVPYGALWSYRDLADAWGNPKAARPAGQACRRNPIPVIIPCHRVITSSGGLNQYSGGSETTPRDAGNLARKDWLQALERRKSEG